MNIVSVDKYDEQILKIDLYSMVDKKYLYLMLMEKTGYLTLTTCQTTEPSGKFTLYGFFKKK